MFKLKYFFDEWFLSHPFDDLFFKNNNNRSSEAHPSLVQIGVLQYRPFTFWESSSPASWSRKKGVHDFFFRHIKWDTILDKPQLAAASEQK